MFITAKEIGETSEEALRDQAEQDLLRLVGQLRRGQIEAWQIERWLHGDAYLTRLYRAHAR